MNEREFYCFISYKHENGGLFKKDHSWAKALESSFHRLRIEVPPVSASKIIRDANNDSDEFIDKVYRDFTNLSGARYEEEIQQGLKQSRKLVSIVSDEMLEDQNKLAEKIQGYERGNDKDNPWCYKEICDFLSFPSHSLDDVLLVYIGPQKNYSSSLVPAPLLDAGFLSKIDRLFSNDEENEHYKSLSLEEQAAYLQSYWHKRNLIFVYQEGEKEDLTDWVAAKVACNIFGVEKEGATAFLSFRMLDLARQRAERKAVRRRIIILILSALVLISLALSWGRVISAYRALDRAKTAYVNNNIPEAIDFSLKAERFSWPLELNEVKEFQWILFEKDYSKPIQIIENKTIIKSPKGKLWEIGHLGRTATLIKGIDKGESLHLPTIMSDDLSLELPFSPDGDRLVIPGLDSIYVVNLADGRYDYLIPYKGKYPGTLGQVRFSPDNEYLLRHWPDSIVIHSITRKESPSVIHESYDLLTASESELLAISHSSDSLSLWRFANEDKKFFEVQSWVLLSDFEDIICNPRTHAIVTISKDVLSYYSSTGSNVLQTISEEMKPIVLFDKETDRFVTVVNSNDSSEYRPDEVTIWEDGFELANNRFDKVHCVSFGNKNELIVYSDDEIKVWNYANNHCFWLDASSCVFDEVNSEPAILVDGNYIWLVEKCISGGTALIYATFWYPDFSILQKPSSNVPEKDSQPDDSPEKTYFQVDDTFYSKRDGHEIISMIGNHDSFLEEEDLLFLWGEHEYSVYSLSEEKLITTEKYPTDRIIMTVRTDAKGEGVLYATLLSGEETDVSTAKNHSWQIAIDLNSGKIANSLYLEGLFLLTNDDGDLIVHSLESDGVIHLLDENLHILNTIVVGDSSVKPRLAINGYYYWASGGNLYKFKFKNPKVTMEPLPNPESDFRGELIDGRYYFLVGNPNLGPGMSGSLPIFLYDVVEKRIVLYLLPAEKIESIEDGKVKVSCQLLSIPAPAYYKRPLLSDKELTRELKDFFN